MNQKTFSIGEIAEKYRIPISTIRYYDKNGLLPLIKRTSGNVRIFSDEDMRLLNMIECLKNTGMQIKDIRTFIEWCTEGDSTIEQRYEMFLERKKETEQQIAALQRSLELIDFKCEYYRKAKEAGTTEIPELQNACPPEIL
ncbi:MAG: MerR family transcriptional regulator [Hespellia sp.]|nr:MerR family transcriptional regulator [Hespellia sp.]